ncbi:MAG TPA: DUF5996 family protein [Solirubrobacterales bacterium]|nr:DUF5996 family protein [Solirubrobacterales bacterium]
MDDLDPEGRIATEPDAPGGLGPLRHPAFRAMWAGQFAGNIGGWMQTDRTKPAGPALRDPGRCHRDTEHATYEPGEVAAGDVQRVEVDWWPGDGRYGGAAFFAYAHPAADGFGEATLDPGAARWDDVRAALDPHSCTLEFPRSAFRRACLVRGWDERLAASAEGALPPVA